MPAGATCRWPWPRSSGRDGRVYAVDSDPTARDEVAAAAAAHSQVLAITQAGEDLPLPEPVDLAFCRFLLLHVVDPAVVLARMAGPCGPGAGWWPRSRSPRPGGSTAARSPCPTARHPDIGALLPVLVRDAGLEIVDAWAEAPAGAGPGPVADYLELLTEVDPGDDPVVLPPLVTVVAQAPGSLTGEPPAGPSASVRDPAVRLGSLAR